MNECTERARTWPDSPTDVSPDELDAFLDHARAEVCPFHAETVSALDAELGSMFRLARGLDSHGRILRGEELKRKIAEHECGQACWKEVSRTMKTPFKGIFLSNRGVAIASSGTFYSFRRYVGKHPLDPQAGLQLWGVLGDESRLQNAPLGFYPLADVLHTGEENFLQLDNGYTVGLKVLVVGEQIFNIEFRCVENEVLEKERAELEKHDKQRVAGPTSSTSITSRFSDKARSCLSWFIPSRERLVPQMAVGVLTCLFVAGMVKVVLTRDGANLPEAPFPAEVPISNLNTHTKDLRGTAVTITNAHLPETTVVGDEKQRRGLLSGHQPAVEKDQTRVKPPRAGSTSGPEPLKKKDEYNLVDNEQAVLLPDSGPESQTNNLTSKRSLGWYFRSSLSSSDPGRWFVIHTVWDSVLRDKLFAEIEHRAFDIGPLTDPPAPQLFVVAWDISRGEKFVTVQAVLTIGGESKVLTFSSAGSCSEQACDRAVKTAVSSVFAVMQHELVERKDGE